MKIKNLFINQSAKQIIGKNIFWLFSGQIIGRLIRSILIIYSARVLITEQWGLLSYILSIVGFLTIFTDFGSNAFATRELSKNTNFSNQINATLLILKSLTIGFITLIIFFVLPKINLNLAPFLFVMLLLIIFDSLREFNYVKIRAQEKMEIEGLIQIITNVLIAIIGFIFLYLSKTPGSLMLGYTIGSGLGTIISSYYTKLNLKNIFKNFSKKLIKPLIFSSFSFGITTIVGALFLNIDIITIGLFKNIEYISWYAASQRIVQIGYLIPLIIVTALLPTLTKINDQKEKIKTLFKNLIILTSILAVFAVSFSFLFSETIITIIYGEKYVSAAPIFQKISLTYIPIFIFLIASNILFIYKKTKELTWCLFGAILIKIIINSLFAKILGINGLIYSTIFIEILMVIYIFYILKIINKS